MATKGIAAPEVGAAYVRARELCQQMGDTPQLFPVLVRLGIFYHGRAQHQTARELGEQCLRLAQTLQDPVLLLQAYHWLGCILCAVGELTLARAYLERGLTFYNSLPHPVALRLGVEDSEVSCLNWLARLLWALGYPEQALQRSTEALTLAGQLAHPYSLAFTLGMAARLHYFRQEVQGEEGIAQIRQGLAAYRATGTEISWPRHLALLAEAYGKVGQPEEGLSVVAEALATVHKNCERFDEAELHRLKGELTLQQFKVTSTQHLTPSTQAEAEACFQK